MIRIGRVTQVYDQCRVRVQYLDLDGQVSGKLKVLQKNTVKNKGYWLPDRDELVVVVAPDLDPQAGIVLGSVYTAGDQPPVLDKQDCYFEFEDGTNIKYNREKSELTIDIQGKADAVIEKDLKLEIKGKANLVVTGDLVLKSDGKIKIESGTVQLGTSSREALLKGNAFQSGHKNDLDLIKNHTHPVDVNKMTALSSAGLKGLQGVMDSHLSEVSVTG